MSSPIRINTWELRYHVTFRTLSTLNQSVNRLPTKFFLLRSLKLECSNETILLECYKKFILPFFNHASPAWSAVSAGDSELMEKLQRRAIRVILNYGYRSPLIPADYDRLGLFPLRARRNVATACWGYKLLHNKIPGAICNFQPFIQPCRYTLIHRHLILSNAAFVPSRQFDSSPLSFAVKLLNSINPSYWDSESVDIFKLNIWNDPTRIIRSVTH